MSGTSSVILRSVAPSTSRLFAKSTYSAVVALCRPDRTLATVVNVPSQQASREDADHVTQNEIPPPGSRLVEWFTTETGGAPFEAAEGRTPYCDLADVVYPSNTNEIFRRWI